LTPTKREVLAGLTALAATASARPGLAAAPVQGQLSNPKATREARALYRYFWEVWGHKTLTGQQESGWRDSGRYELDYILQVTGKQPAILGLDYIDPPGRDGVNHRAIDWYKGQGGIVTLCWHWGNPMIGPGYENSKIAFDVAAALRDGTPENRAMMRDMKQIAGYLGGLQRAGVPVLWRPFHEFTGDWFWWGKAGPEGFKALWVKMHDYFTLEHGLNNLVWMLGYSSKPDAAWYPGRAYADVIGGDTYVKDHDPQKPLYDAVQAISGDAMPIALHECGPIPDPAAVKAQTCSARPIIASSM
jgi:mannan endo-1,4-beta-mannosidase